MNLSVVFPSLYNYTTELLYTNNWHCIDLALKSCLSLFSTHCFSLSTFSLIRSHPLPSLEVYIDLHHHRTSVYNFSHGVEALHEHLHIN